MTPEETRTACSTDAAKRPLRLTIQVGFRRGHQPDTRRYASLIAYAGESIVSVPESVNARLCRIDSHQVLRYPWFTDLDLYHDSAMTLNKESPIPLYYQLVELIKEQILAGEFNPGEQIPPERTLAEHHGISRMTVRQAIAFLVREGVLVARHGHGTFVAEPKVAHDALHLRGFSEEVQRLGGMAVSRVLDQGIVTASPRIATELQLPADTTVVKIVRLRLADATPLLLETAYIPCVLCPRLETEDFSTLSLYSVLEQRYGIRLAYARQAIEATAANAYESDLFGIPVGAPMLLVEGVTYDALNRPIEYFKAIYRGDRMRLRFDSERASASGDRLVRPRHSLVSS